MRTLADLIEDIEWMRDTGETPTGMAHRLNTSIAALEKRLRTHGRPDLARLFWPEKNRAQRRAA